MNETDSPVRTVIKWKDDEAAVLERAAHSSGLTVASFVRAAAIRTARQVLAEAPTLEALYSWVTDQRVPEPAPSAPAADRGEDR